jgi:hypothetical protein
MPRSAEERVEAFFPLKELFSVHRIFSVQELEVDTKHTPRPFY